MLLCATPDFKVLVSLYTGVEGLHLPWGMLFLLRLRRVGSVNEKMPEIILKLCKHFDCVAKHHHDSLDRVWLMDCHYYL